MIIWINGTFGVGKTTAAKGLQKRIPGSDIFDPESVGQLLREQLPSTRTYSDFQDEPLWRELTRVILERSNQSGNRTIIVPMTVTNPIYFDEIVGELRRRGHLVHHVSLMASTTTVKRRLLRRFERPDSWGGQQADARIQALTDPLFNQHIQTDRLTKQGVVDAIALSCDLHIAPPCRKRLF
ncbi:AAA family ATPase [Exiguobacterium sp. s133]|uniref:AAA family ATPase n=1 Tax=Exiguobacterium sp. s133 TaxID=2751213 RepID=UPI001BE8FF83|nr:AAA family ATPase [Exiguobacterium sp. s133]